MRGPRVHDAAAVRRERGGSSQILRPPQAPGTDEHRQPVLQAPGVQQGAALRQRPGAAALLRAAQAAGDGKRRQPQVCILCIYCVRVVLLTRRGGREGGKFVCVCVWPSHTFWVLRVHLSVHVVHHH